MCLIIVKEEGKELVSKQMISEVWIDNPHGAGIIYKRKDNSTFRMIKGIMEEDKLHEVIKDLKLCKNDFIAYHLRWATSGNIDQYNTHPFIVHEDAGKVTALQAISTEKTLFVMHNGVIYDLNDKKAKKSDTVRFISEYLSQLNVRDLFHNEAIQAMIEKFIDGSRLLLAHSAYGVKMYGEWHEHEEYLISKDYCDATKSTNFSTPISNDWWSAWDSKQDRNQAFGSQIEWDWCDGCGQICDEVTYDAEFDGYVCQECKEYLKIMN